MNPYETRQYWNWSARNRGAYTDAEEKRQAKEAIVRRILAKELTAIDEYLVMLGEEFSNEELGQVIILIQSDLLFASWDKEDAEKTRDFLAACQVTLRDNRTL